jgi:hypothetical protein
MLYQKTFIVSAYTVGTFKETFWFEGVECRYNKSKHGLPFVPHPDTLDTRIAISVSEIRHKLFKLLVYSDKRGTATQMADARSIWLKTTAPASTMLGKKETVRVGVEAVI